jgi:muramoyltetrapeptide carboxypeptidase
MITIPPYLKKGDTIGLTCPASYMEMTKAQTCIDTLQNWGYEVMVGKTLGSDSNNYFSGTDEERLNELQAMLDDDGIKAILCGRGGYGLGRIIDKIDFKNFKQKPKWIIGFSDITVLHCHLNSRLKIGSLHAPMAAAFNHEGYKNEYVQSLQKALTGKKTKYQCAVDPFNQQGSVTGELVGGNLALLAHLTGTVSDINTINKILFIEDTGEYIYNVDRMFYQLKRSGKLENLAGLVIGSFTEMKDTIRPFGKNVYEVIHDIVKEYNYPVCFNFPVGHQPENYALKIGVTYKLDVGRNKVKLNEE